MTTILRFVKRAGRTPSNERTVVLIAAVVIFVLIIDMELSNVADIYHGEISSEAGVYAFIVISAFYLIGQRIFLRFTKTSTTELRARRNDIRLIGSIVAAIEIVTIIVFLVIIVEIGLGGSYDLVILVIIVITSNGLSTIVALFLFRRLLSYYKSRPDRAILSYSISGLIIAITSVVTIFFMVPVLASKPDFVSSETLVSFPTFVHGSVLDELNYAFYILSIISFLSIWVSTMILLRNYSSKLGNVRFWVVMSLPLIFYISQIIVIALNIPFLFQKPDNISFIFYYRVIFTVSSTIGGLLFGQPFFLVSKLIPNNSNMYKHLIILGLGMVLFFVSDSATVYHAPFPPFGLPTVALIGISSYMMFMGLYSSAVSLSEDSDLYKLIRTSAKEWKFFLKLSDSELEKNIIEKVDSVRQTMANETGVAPSISPDDVKDYLIEVLDEIKKEHAK